MTIVNTLKKHAFSVAGRIGACDIRDTIMVAGAPRSGTTWLVEILRELPGYKVLTEPLRSPEAQLLHGYESRTCLDPCVDAPDQHTYMQRVLSGQVGYNTGWLTTERNRFRWLSEHARCRKLVVKFCHAGRMLQWINANFDTRGMLLLVRHPCATVSSALKHPGMKSWVSTFQDEPLRAVFERGMLPPPLKEMVDDIAHLVVSPAEALAVTWSLDHFVPFFHFKTAGYPWFLVPYECLVVDRTVELERISEYLGMDLVSVAAHRLGVPSMTTKDQVDNEPSGQLYKWKSHLGSDTSHRILEITRAFGLDFYSQEATPDYEMMSQYDGASCTSSSRCTANESIEFSENATRQHTAHENVFGAGRLTRNAG